MLLPKSIKLVLISVLFFISLPITFAAPITNQAAPNFTATNVLSGQPISLHSLKGKIVVMEWFNNGCPFVKKFYQSGAMQKLQKQYMAKGVEWIVVISSAKGKQGYVANKAQMEQIMHEWNFNPSAVILDPTGSLGHEYAAKTTPHMYIINKQGVLVYQGAIDSIRSTNPADIAKATNYVAKALDEILAGRPVITAQTRSYGCSVKY